MLFPLYGRREGVRLALGLHPLEVVKIDLARELSLFRSYAAHTSYIGEIGLDLSHEGKPSQCVQEEVFDALLMTPGVANKVLSVHSRGASREIIRRLRDAQARRVILHWFSGSTRDLETALDAGFYFSINPAMARSVRGRDIITSLPRERVLAETDGPYVRIRGRELEPKDVLLVHDYLATQWRVPAAVVAEVLAHNLARLCHGLPASSPTE